MNKKIIMLVGLVLVVGVLLALATNGCGTEDNPCPIPSEHAIQLVQNKWYSFGESQIVHVTSILPVPYFYNPQTQRIEPSLERGDISTPHRVLDTNGETFYLVRFASPNLPSAAATTAGASPAAEGLETVNINGVDQQLTSATYTAFATDCGSNPSGCTITAQNSYTHDLGSDQTETVTVRDEGVTIRENTQTDTVTIMQGLNTFSTSTDTYTQLLPAGAESLSVSAANQLRYSVSGEERTAIDHGWGVEMQREVSGAQQTESYLIGTERITRDTEGNWEFRGEEYAADDVVIDDGGLRLGSENKDRVTIAQTGRGTEITEIDVEGSDETSTTTILQPDGTTIVEERENGRLVSREARDADGRRLEDVCEENCEGNNRKGTVFYEENGRPSGWCSAPYCTTPETQFRWDDRDCRGQYDAFSCYTNGAPEGFQDVIYENQLWNSELGWQETMSTIFSRSVSFYPFANEWDWYGEWVRDVDRFFAEHYLGEEYVESAICSIWWDVEPVDGVALVQTPQGTFQLAGHVVAERIPVGPLICDDEGKCPGNLECREDQFCYGEEADEPTEGSLYKIDWGVIAPRDEQQIGARGAGQSIKFNLVAYKNGVPTFLFSDAAGRGNRNTITLEKGESSSATYAPLIVEYSPETFTKICIEWSDDEEFVPQTIGEKVTDICKTVVEISPGRTLEESTDPTGVSQSRTIRYCTLSGCR